jgi:hypothetical protein
MAISYTSVPLVAAGGAITSTNRVKLARAFNDRIRSGLGDPTYRIFYSIFSLFRQVRNKDASGFLWPTEAEFLEFYQNLNASDAQWPAAAPDDPEGANLRSQMNTFVFGAAAVNMDDEATRLGVVPLSAPATPGDAWDLAKSQRGAVDPTSVVLGSPVFYAAHEHFKIGADNGMYSFHGNSFGGFAPVPVLLGDCGDGTADTPATPDWELKFTALDATPTGEVVGASATLTGNVYSYAGTCPAVTGDVYWIAEMPWAYYVYVVDQTDPDVYPTEHWIAGPYSGGARLRKQPNKLLDRALNYFVREFRGADSQRLGHYNLDDAFDFQHFLGSQYQLAPQYGHVSGASVIADYPLFTVTAPGSAPFTQADGTLLHLTGTSTTEYSIHAGFVFASCHITSLALTAAVSIELRNDTTVLRTIVLTPTAGVVDEVVILAAPVQAAPLRIALAGVATFTDATGHIDVEVAELSDYYPQPQDAYLFLRLAGAVNSTAMDGRGIDETSAKNISDTYKAYGCIVNAHGASGLPGQTVEVNVNGVFDAARRMSQYIRCVPRTNFIGYAVIDGKSVCWLKRFAMGMGSPVVDVASGDIVEGVAYQVMTGSITYNGTVYGLGAVFYGVASVTTFTGTGTVRVYLGQSSSSAPNDLLGCLYPIVATAPADGETNEWVMDVQFKVYHTSDSSIWKQDSYSDHWALSNRCVFYAYDYGNAKEDLAWHFSRGQKLSIAPEAPSGYNYVHDINNSTYYSSAQKLTFYKSCRIYEPPMEIESVESVTEGGEEVLKLTFKTRFHHCSTAPSSIARDTSTWTDDFENEEYRTTENGLRAYLNKSINNVNCVPLPGDSGQHSDVWGLPDNPYGACFPHFWFTKLIPEPYIDANDTPDASDTEFMHDPFVQMDIYLKAMCEGYMDDATTTAFGCQCFEVGGPACAIFDYTFENLCFEAFGSSWMNALPNTQTGEHNILGYGPMPNTLAYAEIYNQFAKCLNLLTRVRVMLPYKWESKIDTYQDSQSITPTNASDGSPLTTCTTTGVVAAYWEGTPITPTTLISSVDWTEDGGASSSYGAVVSNNSCDGNNWILVSTREHMQWRWNPLSADVLSAIPEAWQDMCPTNLGTLVRYTYGQSVTSKALVADINNSSHCCFTANEPCPGFWAGPGGQYWAFVNTVISDPVCLIASSGVAQPDPLGSHVFTLGRTADGNPCFSGVANTVTIEPLPTESMFVTIPLV